MSTDPDTLAAYERGATTYRANRTPHLVADAHRLVAETPDGPVLDLGCGPGQYLPHLGDHVIGIDPVDAVARLAAEHARPVVRASAEALPFAAHGAAGVWARNSLLHLRHGDLALALAEIHRVLRPGGRLLATVLAGDDGDEEPRHGGSDLPGRTFYRYSMPFLRDALAGAGFDEVAFADDEAARRYGDPVTIVRARRARTLPDTVGPNMRLLVCGLNPSLHAADAGVGFVSPSNRFWPAAIAAGLVERSKQPHAALRDHGIGMTDLVKRATRRADELDPHEYRTGLDRLRRLCERLRPGALCMVGLAGWRAAVDRNARPGWQAETVGGRPVYVMPSTSGLNAHASLDDLVGHLRAAAGGRDGRHT